MYKHEIQQQEDRHFLVGGNLLTDGYTFSNGWIPSFRGNDEHMGER